MNILKPLFLALALSTTAITTQAAKPTTSQLENESWLQPSLNREYLN